MDLAAASVLLRLLSDPTRVRLLALLEREELTVAEIKPQRTTGIIGLAVTIHNQDGVLVMDGMQRYLIRKRAV